MLGYDLTGLTLAKSSKRLRIGRLKALGIGNAQRIPSLAEFPTIAEAGVPGYEAYAWGGMIGPANVSKFLGFMGASALRVGGWWLVADDEA